MPKNKHRVGRRVINLASRKIYESARAAGEALGVHPSNINGAASNGTPFRGAGWAYLGDDGNPVTVARKVANKAVNIGPGRSPLPPADDEAELARNLPASRPSDTLRAAKQPPLGESLEQFAYLLAGIIQLRGDDTLAALIIEVTPVLIRFIVPGVTT